MIHLRHLRIVGPLGLVAFAFAFTTASPALADDAANTATARALGIEGVTLADNGKCREAIEKLTRAEELHHAPTTATRLGECEIEIGRLVTGTERLQRVVREPLHANAPPVFTLAAARAKTVLDKTLPRIATLRITVRGASNVKYTLTIDDEVAPSAVVDTNRSTDPGTHRIQVSAPGYLSNGVTTTLEEGQTDNVTLELRPDPNAPASVRASADVEGAPPPAVSSSKVPAFVAFGIGALGLGVGLVGAANVASKSSALDRSCTDKTCPTDSDGDIRAAKDWATVSTVGFVTAGVGAATGVVLLLVSGGGTKPETGRRSIRPSVGLGSVGVNGTF